MSRVALQLAVCTAHEMAKPCEPTPWQSMPSSTSPVSRTAAATQDATDRTDERAVNREHASMLLMCSQAHPFTGERAKCGGHAYKNAVHCSQA